MRPVVQEASRTVTRTSPNVRFIDTLDPPIYLSYRADLRIPMRKMSAPLRGPAADHRAGPDDLRGLWRPRQAPALLGPVHPQGRGLVRHRLSVRVAQKGQGIRVEARQAGREARRHERRRRGGLVLQLLERYGRRLTLRTAEERLTTTGVPRRARRRVAALPSRTAISSRPLPPTSAPACPGISSP